MSEPDQKRRDRRRLLAVGGAVAVGGMVDGCAFLRWGASHPVYAPPSSGTPNPELLVPKAELQKLGQNEALELRPGDGFPDLLLVRVERLGRFAVVASDCTHWGCTIDWDGLRAEWKCPCHGSRFTVDGRVVEGPADTALGAPTFEEGPEGLTIHLATLPV